MTDPETSDASVKTRTTWLDAWESDPGWWSLIVRRRDRSGGLVQVAELGGHRVRTKAQGWSALSEIDDEIIPRFGFVRSGQWQPGAHSGYVAWVEAVPSSVQNVAGRAAPRPAEGGTRAGDSTTRHSAGVGLAHGSPPAAGTVELIDAFSDYLRSRGRSARTIALYEYRLRQFAESFPDAAAVAPKQIDEWVRGVAARPGRAHRGETLDRDGLAPNTVNTIIKALRAFYGWADRFGVVRPNPTLLLDLVPNPHRMGRVVDDGRLDEILADASPTLRAALLLGRLGGLRLSEIAAVRSTDRKDNWLTIIGKGSKQRQVFVVPELAAALNALAPNAEGYLFPGRSGGHMNPDGLRKIIERCGINAHALRHAAGTAVYAASKDLRATQAFLGHSNPQTTAIYVHVSHDTLRDAAIAGAARRADPERSD